MFDSTTTPPIADTRRRINSVITEKLNKAVKLSKRLRSLKAEAKAIQALANRADDKMLVMALRAARMKRRIIAGYAGPNVKWMSWMRTNVKMSESHLYALVAIGDAPIPAAALDDWRRDNRERSKGRGIKKPPPPKTDPPLTRNHRLMLKLVRKLSKDEVKGEYLRLFCRYRHLVK